jgi:hypothetical protein
MLLGKTRQIGSYFDSKFGRGIIKKVMYVHVPKCGGSSVGMAIKNSFGYWANLQQKGLNWINTGASNQAAKLVEIPINDFRQKLLIYFLSQKNSRFVTGHVTINHEILEAFGGQWNFISILREPVERWYSQYYFNKNRDKSDSKTDLDMEAYLTSQKGVRSARTYSYYFSNDGPDIEQNILEAKANLSKFSIVGFLEDISNFEKQYNDLFDAGISIPHYNKNKAPRYQKEDIPSSIHERVVEMCRADTEIYNWALEACQ